MLSGANIHTTLPCQDLDRARAFYRDRLGLEPATESPAGLTYEVGGGRFFLFTSRGMAIADVGGVRSAWFKDSEGNLLGIVQIPEGE
jgi:predicted enzyme related to lactoylglutathione lyase